MTTLIIQAFAGLTLLVLATQPDTGQADGWAGCYRADRPLGTAASASGVPGPMGERIGESGEGLRTLQTFRLLDSGRVDRPGTVMQHWWALGSSWSVASDTLNVRLSTVTSGWHLRLIASHASDETIYQGDALYLTDVIVKGWEPPRVKVVVRRELCAPSTNTP